MVKFIWMFIMIAGGLIVLALADFAAMWVGSLTSSGEWIVNMSELVVCGAIGVLGGRIAKKNWCVVALIPILYFGYIAVIMGKIDLLYLGMNGPLALITILTTGFLGAASHKTS